MLIGLRGICFDASQGTYFGGEHCLTIIANDFLMFGMTNKIAFRKSIKSLDILIKYTVLVLRIRFFHGKSNVDCPSYITVSEEVVGCVAVVAPMSPWVKGSIAET